MSSIAALLGIDPVMCNTMLSVVPQQVLDHAGKRREGGEVCNFATTNNLLLARN